MIDQSQFLEPVWVSQPLLNHTDGDEDMGISLRKRLGTNVRRARRLGRWRETPVKTPAPSPELCGFFSLKQKENNVILSQIYFKNK